jgi:hypothetical protein
MSQGITPPRDDYDAPRPPGPGGHSGVVTAIGVINIIFGALDVILGLVIMIAGPTLLNVLFHIGSEAASNAPGGNPADAARIRETAGAATGIAGMIVAFAGVCVMILAVPVILAGVGVLKRRPWGRILTIILGILAAIGGVIGILTPAGWLNIAYAVFVLVVLFNAKYAAEFR